MKRLLDSQDNPVAAFRQALQAGTEHLFALYDQGVIVDELVLARSRLVDMLLCEAWQRYMLSGSGAALVAVGGYGRQELHPGSDVDVMILLEASETVNLSPAGGDLITFLFDIGLNPGYSVRTVEDCVQVASTDATVITNLIESRLLAGSSALFDRMRTATAPDRIWPSDAFFEAKTKEQQARWHKFGDTAYNLEPNIKENPGGLRDIQMIGWVAKRHFDAETLHDLVTHNFLTEGEHLALVEGQSLLWRIRFVLHRLTGRSEDRLLFDYQRALATEFGFTGASGNLAVEQFMQRYYRTVMELNRLNEMLLQLFQEAILLHDRLGPPININERFQHRSGFLEVTEDEVFVRDPVALIEVFYILRTHPEIEAIRASTIRLIREHRHLIDDRVRGDERARSLFIEILRFPGATHAMERMNHYGVLAAYIPAFANVVGRMQYDLFHVYTVDEHSLRVMRNLRCFLIPEHGQEFPLCSAIARTIPKVELLCLSGLFHDIAKGRGGDHSHIGARDAWEFCRLHDLSDYDSRLVAWLVEKHLIMSMTAQHKDTGDPDVIQTFAAEVGDPIRLDYLYLLTVADVRGTNPARWNSWKESLLRDLYHGTRRALVRGLDNPQAQDDLIQQKQTEALRLLSKYGASGEDCKTLWLKFSLDYFLHNSPDEIVWQTRMILQASAETLPLVAIRPLTHRGGTEIFIYTWDREHLFARTTALLDRWGLSIMDARIMTTDDEMALNSYYVLEMEESSPILDDAQVKQIQKALVQALSDQEAPDLQVARPVPRQLRHFPTETKVHFSADERNHRTVMRLVTLDRPGLLAQVGAVFDACGIRLQNAKIATVGAQADDIFFITAADGTPITEQDALNHLRQEIHGHLEDRPDH
ncbi:MAG: [protein-PII] uridylyltransferase [Chromatiaceae bacterium]|nr:[protein-PII] uridylyltransferase [Chromatiaceae bacterium]